MTGQRTIVFERTDDTLCLEADWYSNDPDSAWVTSEQMREIMDFLHLDHQSRVYYAETPDGGILNLKEY